MVRGLRYVRYGVAISHSMTLLQHRYLLAALLMG